jgi:DcuC family C4-dicarboxylate transporter
MPAPLSYLLGLAIIAAAAWGVLRKMDVRMVLLLAAFALSGVAQAAGRAGAGPAGILQKFFATLTAAEYVIPICCAMGFAFVLKHTLCDQHLVHLLVNPLRKVRPLLVPGAVVVGFLVNIPIISQTSAAVAIGSVLIPILLAARVSRPTAGAALLLGASVGGELLNQGAPEFRTVGSELAALQLPVPSGSDMVRTALPFVLLQLTVATLCFWFLSRRAEAAAQKEDARAEAIEPPGPDLLRINPFKAAVPILPLVLLFLAAPPLSLIHVPVEWLVGAKETASLLQKSVGAHHEIRFANAVQEAFDSRLIGLAMLVGTVIAALTDRTKAAGSARAFFEGAGYAFANVISIIVVAATFGEGVKMLGLAEPLGALILRVPHLLQPLAGFLPMAFGAVSGSGMAATQSLYDFFARPAVAVGANPEPVGALVALGAAAGRTMSPVAAVTLMCASLTETEPAQLVRRVAPPLMIGIAVVVLFAMISAGVHR